MVTISQREKMHVQRSLDEKQTLLGIVSTKPGFVAGRPASSTYAIALVGRVPTKVSTIRGSIQTGDLLAPSTIPGIAVKAIGAGPVVGQALEPYDGLNIGKIQVFVHPMWWGGPETASQPAPVSVSQVVTSTTPVLLTTPKSYQGFAVVAAGGVKVHVSYPSLLAYPNVQATPRGEVDGGWWTDRYTDIGFDIILKQAQTHEVVFAWQVTATAQDASVSVSDGSKASIDPTNGQIIFDSPSAVTTTTAVTDVSTTPTPITDVPVSSTAMSSPETTTTTSVVSSTDAVLPAATLTEFQVTGSTTTAAVTNTTSSSMSQ